MNKIRISGIVEESIVDGPGIRFVLFTQGCKHNCRGCHNPESHKLEGGNIMDIEDIENMIKSNPLVQGITFSGGEPFEQALACSNLAKKIKDLGLNTICYTGYTFEFLFKNMKSNPDFKEFLLGIDILIDGRYDIDKDSKLIRFRGSTNQRILDVKKSLKNGKAIIIESLMD